MKKLIKYIFLFILLIFILPAVFTKGAINVEIFNNLKEVSSTLLITYNNEIENNVINSSINNEESLEQNTNEIITATTIDYLSQFPDNTATTTIKLYHTDTDTVEELNMNEYLYGVVSSEMPVDYEFEALRAQAVVARTYTIYKMSGDKHSDVGADICDDPSCCQAWISQADRYSYWDADLCDSNWEKIMAAVNSTNTQIITYDNTAIAAFFHANSGGTTEIPLNVWGGSNYPYLQSVETSGEDQYSQYSSELIITFDDLLTNLKQTYPDIEIDFENTVNIKILEYTDEGRVKTIQFGNYNLSRSRN